MSCSRPLARMVLAAVLGGAVLADAQAQRLGRLFTSPDERRSLDELRLQAGVERPVVTVELPPEPEPGPLQPESTPAGPQISRLVVNGIMQRSRGPGTVWINGDPVERGGVSREGVAVESTRASSGSVRLRLPSGAGTVALRPGQQIDIDNGTLLEAYEQRSSRAMGSAFQAPSRVTEVPHEAGRDGTADSRDVPPPPTTEMPASRSEDARATLADRLRGISELPPTEQARALERLQTESRDTPVPAPSR